MNSCLPLSPRFFVSTSMPQSPASPVVLTQLLVLPCSSVFCSLCPNTVTVLNQRDSHTASCTTGACKLQCKLKMGRVRKRVPELCHMVSSEHYSFYSILHLSYSDKRLEHPVFSDKRLGHPVSISVCNCFTA